ncbi:MAG: hypothetical protein IPN83_21535 [Holophagales bacterium]|nr:hypothetical protein [Holophagales bacterium]
MRLALFGAFLALCLGGLPPLAAASSRSELPEPALLDATLQAGCGYLVALQRADGAICDRVNPLFEIWETVAGANALLDCGVDRREPVLEKALAFLRTNENAEGLICHNRRCRAGYCLETTAEYLLLLSRLDGPGRIAPRLAPVVTLQAATGEWVIGNPDVRDVPNFASVTGFVLAMLDAARLKPRSRSGARDWLLARQTVAGDWGQAWEYYGCSAYPLWPVLRALSQLDGAATRKARERAEAFIRSSQATDGSWTFVDPQRARGVSRELQTALMLSALRHAGPVRNQVAIQRGVEFLLASQRPDGSWDGGLFPIDSARYQKEESAFATARAISVLAWYCSRPGR